MSNAENDSNVRILNRPEKLLKRGIRHAELIGLTVIAIATVYAGCTEIISMVRVAQVTLGDLLLLFLYLEVLAMVAIYLDSGKLPIRLPIYIAVVALARYLILEMKNLNEWEMIAIAATITLLSVSTLILRFGSIRFPYKSNQSSKQTSVNDNQDW